MMLRILRKGTLGVGRGVKGVRGGVRDVRGGRDVRGVRGMDKGYE